MCEKDFQVNEKGWYTYKGKLVIATATKYLFSYGYSRKENIIYYRYYDILNIKINGTIYEAIVLDSCGACMKNKIIDLFVANRSSVITTMITVE